MYPRPVDRPRALAAALLVAGTAAAAEPEPGGIPDLLGPRSLALGASIGVAAGNDGIFVNSAALAARRRYSIESEYILDRRGAENAGMFYGGSVVDSLSSPVTGGLAYTRAAKGLYTGNLVHFALAGPVADKLFLGVTAKYLSASGPDKVSAATADASIYWEVADYLSIGAAGYNLVPIANDAVAPTGAGAGVSIGSDQVAHLSADWRADFPRSGKTLTRYAIGAEVLLGQLVPVRAGWVKDERLDTRWWSLGAGLVSRNGVALDIAYRQSVEAPSARTMGVSLKAFFLQ